ncbi:MAG: glycoside hydrolase family 3 N-terminal domain-containing protein [Bacteroidota bacterium]|jgi:beta-N-acetylhexosaminidase
MLLIRKIVAAFMMMIPVLVCGGQAVDSLDIKIGQMILIGVPGTGIDDAVMAEVKQGKVGGILFFEKNIPPTNSFDAFSRVIWQYQSSAAIPLFMCIDQEGGRVNRLKTKYGFPRSVTAAEMGAAETKDTVRYYARTTAATLAGLGLNVNFAPCVDLASNPDNPVIAKFGRAFSADEVRVTERAADFIREHRRLNVITVPKHFPGHGSSDADTHLGMADVTATWEERELVPYQHLIEQGLVDAVMSAHIVNRKLDPEGHPGTLSSAMLDGMLRKKLGFDGVVFSDDMQMHAITRHYGLEQAIQLAISAGIDVMTFSNNIKQSEERTVDRVHRVIKDLVQSGKISKERIDKSYRRIMALKRQYLYDDVNR